MVEADRGYRGEPTKVRIPVDYATEEEKRQKSVIRSRHETVNARLKSFKALSERFRHHISADDMSNHYMVCTAVAIITQLSIANGERLFPVEHH